MAKARKTAKQLRERSLIRKEAVRALKKSGVIYREDRHNQRNRDLISAQIASKQNKDKVELKLTSKTSLFVKPELIDTPEKEAKMINKYLALFGSQRSGI